MIASHFSRTIALLIAMAAFALAAFLLSGCEAARPYAHVNASGYEVGIFGTWKAVANEAIHAANLNDGKQIVKVHER